MIRWVAAGFAVLFTLVVAMGYVPSFVTAVHGEDRILFDLFKISLLDDVTHAGTAVAGAGRRGDLHPRIPPLSDGVRLLLRPGRRVLSDLRRAERTGADGQPDAQRSPHCHSDRDAGSGLLVGAPGRLTRRGALRGHGLSSPRLAPAAPPAPRARRTPPADRGGLALVLPADACSPPRSAARGQRHHRTQPGAPGGRDRTHDGGGDRRGGAHARGPHRHRRRALQHGRTDRRARRAPDRHAPVQSHPGAGYRREDDHGPGRRAVAPDPGGDRPPRSLREDHADLRQLHGRRLGIGQRARPLRRAGTAGPFHSQPAGRARGRDRGGGEPHGEPGDLRRRRRRLRRAGGHHRRHPRPRQERPGQAPPRGDADRRLRPLFHGEGAVRLPRGLPQRGHLPRRLQHRQRDHLHADRRAGHRTRPPGTRGPVLPAESLRLLDHLRAARRRLAPAARGGPSGAPGRAGELAQPRGELRRRGAGAGLKG